MTRLRYFTPSVQRGSSEASPTASGLTIKLSAFHQHYFAATFRERPNEVRFWDIRRFSLLPSGTWDLDCAIESPAEIFVLRHRFPVKRICIGPSCFVTVTKESKSSTVAQGEQQFRLSFLVLWNSFGEQVIAMPLTDPIVSICVNSEAVFVLQTHRLICIAVATGELVGELTLTTDTMGFDCSDCQESSFSFSRESLLSQPPVASFEETSSSPPPTIENGRKKRGKGTHDSSRIRFKLLYNNESVARLCLPSSEYEWVQLEG